MTVEAVEPALDQLPDLVVSFRHVGHRCVLELHGGLHSGSVGVLEAQFDRLGRTPCHRVVVDLRDVLHLDTTGARVLVGLRHYVRARGGRLTTLGASSGVRSLLRAEEARGR